MCLLDRDDTFEKTCLLFRGDESRNMSTNGREKGSISPRNMRLRLRLNSLVSLLNHGYAARVEVIPNGGFYAKLLDRLADNTRYFK